MALVDGITLQLELLEGKDLVAKDRQLGFIGKKNSSDPYALVQINGKTCFKSKVQKKTLNPHWNEHFTYNIDDYHSASEFLTNIPRLEIVLLDHDTTSEDDPMGTVEVPLYQYVKGGASSVQKEWFPVQKGSGKYHCHNAKGSICLSITITAKRLLRLVPGNVHPLQHSSRIHVGLAWDCETEAIDLDASCVAITTSGQIDLEHTVYYGNTSNSNNSIVHSGDETTGETMGDDETIAFQLDQIPHHILALYLILSVATPNKTLAQVESTKIRFYHPKSGGHTKEHGICGLMSYDFGGEDTSLILARLDRAHGSGEWRISPIMAGTSPARDFGFLMPQIKSYTRDLMPQIEIDPNERVAIVRKGGALRVRDFCPDQKIPTTMSFGLAWDVTDGASIDLDASAICLGPGLNEVDLIFWQHLNSKDGSIYHTGDNRSGEGSGDDETINILLEGVDPSIKYIGTIINSYSGQELDDVARASCRLYDTETRTEIARYALTDSKSLDKHTALVMGCLYRSGNEWLLRIISEPAQGRTVKDNVDELQNHLRSNPPPAAPTVVIPEEQEISMKMPDFVEHNKEEEIAVVPIAAVEAAPPKKFIKVNGVNKLNPEYKKWKAEQQG